MTQTERVIVPYTFSTAEAKPSSSVKVMVEQAGWLASRDAQVSLCTSPLGAGLGVALYDPTIRAGGLLHCLLPSSSLDAKRAATRPALFLDSGWAALFTRLLQMGATKRNLRVFVAGAAEIIDETALFNIGKLNQDFLHEFLRQLSISINAENLGGRTNCSMELGIATGEIRLKFSGQHTSQFLCKP